MADRSGTLADFLVGYSPEQLEDWTQRFGGVDPLMERVQSARYREASADPALLDLTPENRAALDRYTTFAKMREQSSNPLESAANYVGGMGAMAATEALKAARPAQRVASAIWSAVSGGKQSDPQFFGGQDTSGPSLANLLAAHYGYVRGGGR